jgi:hypothetical protein
VQISRSFAILSLPSISSPFICVESGRMSIHGLSRERGEERLSGLGYAVTVGWYFSGAIVTSYDHSSHMSHAISLVWSRLISSRARADDENDREMNDNATDEESSRSS